MNNVLTFDKEKNRCVAEEVFIRNIPSGKYDNNISLMAQALMFDDKIQIKYI